MRRSKRRVPPAYETKDFASVLLVREAEAGIQVRLADQAAE